MIPLATVADTSQLDILAPLLSGASVVVIGSAPIRSRFVEVLDGEISMPVNGAISSVLGKVDLWVLGSKHYDTHEANTRFLHKTMLDQGKDRQVQRAVFLRGPKHMSEAATLERLRSRRCEVATWSVLDKPTKRWLEGEYCGRVDDKQPCSSGVLAAAMALWCGAASVRLSGFSLQPGYQYLPKQTPQPWWRDHIEADRRALRLLRQRFKTQIQGDIFAGL